MVILVHKSRRTGLRSREPRVQLRRLPRKLSLKLGGLGAGGLRAREQALQLLLQPRGVGRALEAAHRLRDELLRQRLRRLQPRLRARVSSSIR